MKIRSTLATARALAASTLAAPAISHAAPDTDLSFHGTKPDKNTVACGTYGAQRGWAAFETIACVTYHI